MVCFSKAALVGQQVIDLLLRSITQCCCRTVLEPLSTPRSEQLRANVKLTLIFFKPHISKGGLLEEWRRQRPHKQEFQGC